LEAAALRAARVFLFLLPGGRPRRQGDEGVAAAAGAVFLLLPFRTARPLFFWDAHITGSPSRPGCSGSGRSDGGRGREGLQGLLIAAPLRATALPRCRRRHFRRLGLPLTPFWELVTTDGGTTEEGHDWVGLREKRLEAKGEVGVHPPPRALLAFKEER
jgi:hypothetical protein